MPRRSRPIQSYPPQFFDFYSKAIETPQGVELRLPTIQDAIRLRMQLYGFRRSLLRALETPQPSDQLGEVMSWMHKVSDVAIGIQKNPDNSGTIQGKTLIHFYAYFAEQLAKQGVQVTPGLDRPAMTFEEIAKESAMRVFQKIEDSKDGQLSDDHEDFIQRWLDGGQKEQAEGQAEGQEPPTITRLHEDENPSE